MDRLKEAQAYYSVMKTIIVAPYEVAVFMLIKPYKVM